MSAAATLLGALAIALRRAATLPASVAGERAVRRLAIHRNTLSYRLDNKNESGFLQNNSAPAYYGQYHFKQDKLVRFSFGFEFP